MRATESTEKDPNDAAADTWPWACLDCGTTIYHDGEFCPDCAAAHRVDDAARRPDAPDGFLDWMRRESVSGYVLKVATIAGVEVALTAIWLRVLVGAPSAVDFLGPTFA